MDSRGFVTVINDADLGSAMGNLDSAIAGGFLTRHSAYPCQYVSRCIIRSPSPVHFHQHWRNAEARRQTPAHLPQQDDR